MAYTNTHLRLEIGNVVSRIVGPAPNEVLDRLLNPHLQGRSGSDAVCEVAGRRQARVFDPRDQTFLTGALRTMEVALRNHGCLYRILDRRVERPRRHEWVLRGMTLRRYQECVVEAAVSKKTGTIDLGTSGGKTVLAAAIIARLGLPTLYLVTTRTLLHQTVESMRRYLGTEPGVIGDGVRRSGPLTIAIAQAITQGSSDLEPWKDGVMIWDEGHHAAAPSYLDLLKRIDARYNFFLSAVPYRSGEDQVVLDAVTGGTLTDGEYSASYLIDHGYACPVEVRIEASTTDRTLVEQPFWKIYHECVVLNEDRNRRIAEIAKQGIESEDSILILVERVHHGRLLRDRIAEDVGFAYGSLPKSALRKLTEEFATGRLRCLIATVGLFNEGISIQGITLLIQAGGMKSRAKVLQAVGRGMRQAPGKTSVTYVDFFDDDPLGVLRGHSRDRLAVLMDAGFRVPKVDGHLGPDESSSSTVECESSELDPGSDGIPTIPGTYAVPSTWTHVPGTRTFLRISPSGAIVGRGECVSQGRVPGHFCKRCNEPWVCKQGGKISWQETDPV